MQLTVFESDKAARSDGRPEDLGLALARRNVPSVVYEDVNNPHGLGVLSWTEQPLDFATKLRPVFGEPEAKHLTLRREFTMLGRTYSTGYEADLEYWLLRRPRETVLNEAWPWAVWYPLRRSGEFERWSPASGAPSCANTPASVKPTARKTWRTTCGSPAMGSTPTTTSS